MAAAALLNSASGARVQHLHSAASALALSAPGSTLLNPTCSAFDLLAGSRVQAAAFVPEDTVPLRLAAAASAYAAAVAIADAAASHFQRVLKGWCATRTLPRRQASKLCWPTAW